MKVVFKRVAETIRAKPVEQTPSDWQMSNRDWVAVLGASLGAFLAILDIQITNASLREIQGALGLDFAEGGWISTSYLIAEVVVIPLTGFLSSVFGMRRYILVNAVLFVIASLLCGMAWNIESMITFRVFQGLTGGILIPMSFQCMLLFMPPEKKPIGLAIFGMTATLAPTLGPSLGGFLTENYGWRWNFFMNLFPGALMIAAISYGLPFAKMDLSRLKKMDIAGTLSLVLGLGSLTFVLEDGARSEWFENEHIRIAFLIAMAALPTFVALQVLRKEPLLDLKLLLRRNFGLSALITMFTATALYGGIYALSLYLGQIQNYGASTIGQVMMWVGIPQLFVMPLLPLLMRYFDLRALAVVGLALFSWSNYLNSGLDLNFSGEQLSFSLIVRAIGQPLFLIPLSALGMSVISPAEAGNASSIFNVLRNLGGSIGIAMTGTLLVSRQAEHVQHNLEFVSASRIQVTERLTGIQRFFQMGGTESVKAKAQATKLLVAIAQRESAIQSFGDIFFLMSLILLVCVSIVFFLKRAAAPIGGGDVH